MPLTNTTTSFGLYSQPHRVTQLIDERVQIKKHMAQFQIMHHIENQRARTF